MNIEFTLEDYFNELHSMEKYYGQEEELYPWIYMLLQMVEIRKKNILKEDYDKLCIIDVHNAQYAKSDYDLKKLMQGHVTDFAIVDPNSDSVCGCVEIKKIDLANPLELKEGTLNVDTLSYQFDFDFKKSNDTSSSFKPSLDDYIPLENLLKIYIVYKEVSNNIRINLSTKPPLELPSELPSELPTKSSIVLKSTQASIDDNTISASNNANRTTYYIDVTVDNCSKEIINLIHLSPKKDSVKLKDNVTVDINITRKATISDSGLSSLSAEDKKQLVWHLINFKKVLYTNGLAFYYIDWDDNNIFVEKIADLTKCYFKACKTHTRFASMTSDERLSAYAEWDKLIAGLTAINWHHEPITKID